MGSMMTGIKKPREVVSIDIIKEFLVYDKDTGKLYWKVRDVKYFNDGERKANACSIWNSRYSGKEAGCPDGSNRIVIRIFKNTFFAHRLAFILMEGREPIEQIDHINGNSLDNRWCNIRECVDYQNKQNLTVRSNSSTKVQGVYFFKKRLKKPYEARIRLRGKKYYLGTFKTAKEAGQAYLEAKQKLHTFQPTPRKG
jgi:hypothetical protein